MKLSKAIWISLAVPGTEIEIIALIVKNDISFNRPQIYQITNDIDKFTTIPPGTAVVDITSMPPLNFAATEAASLLTCGGTVAYWFKSKGRKQSIY